MAGIPPPAALTAALPVGTCGVVFHTTMSVFTKELLSLQSGLTAVVAKMQYIVGRDATVAILRNEVTLLENPPESTGLVK